ncbi:MAG TPA: glycosyltransferase family 2 protein [Firmicutes bacterium]|nr:glycosyltransferase family 2 protein [Bacillota bacterium]
MEVAAIIPAYNEGKTIGAILSVLQKCPQVKQIIVVSDGSTDHTVKVALSFKGVEVVELPCNIGKGGAIMAGLKRTRAEVLLFLDADLIGLTSGHVSSLLIPVLESKAQMAVGIFERGRMATDLAQKMAPFLSGQRALTRSLLEKVAYLDISRFGMEVVLNRYAEEHKIPTVTVYLSDLSHVLKEEKLGIWKGSQARLQMYWEIIKYAAKASLHSR